MGGQTRGQTAVSYVSRRTLGGMRGLLAVTVETVENLYPCIVRGKNYHYIRTYEHTISYLMCYGHGRNYYINNTIYQYLYSGYTPGITAVLRNTISYVLLVVVSFDCSFWGRSQMQPLEPTWNSCAYRCCRWGKSKHWPGTYDEAKGLGCCNVLYTWPVASCHLSQLTAYMTAHRLSYGITPALNVKRTICKYNVISYSNQVSRPVSERETLPVLFNSWCPLCRAVHE